MVLKLKNTIKRKCLEEFFIYAKLLLILCRRCPFLKNAMEHGKKYIRVLMREPEEEVEITFVNAILEEDSLLRRDLFAL